MAGPRVVGGSGNLSKDPWSDLDANVCVEGAEETPLVEAELVQEPAAQAFEEAPEKTGKFQPKYQCKSTVTKAKRWFGAPADLHSPVYDWKASWFGSDAERLGRKGEPLTELLMVGGADAGDIHTPVFLEKFLDYLEGEVLKGVEPNPLIFGDSPSKGAWMLEGVPVVWWKLYDALQKRPYLKHVVVVGAPDVGVWTKAFKVAFASELAARETPLEIEFFDQKGGFIRNIQELLSKRTDSSKMAILAMVDTPKADLDNIAFDPWRNKVDYILGANVREMVLHTLGMNFHYEGYEDGVGSSMKEGNIAGLLQWLESFINGMFSFRKSVLGVMKKVYVFLEHGAISVVKNPAGLIDVVHLITDVMWRSAFNALRRSVGAEAPKIAASYDLAEQVMRNLGFNPIFRPNHIDPDPLLDIDGLRDVILAEFLLKEDDPETLRYLQRKVRRLPEPFRSQVMTSDQIREKANEYFTIGYHGSLKRESDLIAAGKKPNGITDAKLRARGVHPDVLPYVMQPNGHYAHNEAWLEILLPRETIDKIQRSRRANRNRGEHAKGLLEDFGNWVRETVADAKPTEISQPVKDFVLKEFNRDPARYQSLIVEWNFDQLEDMMVERARKNFGPDAPELAQIHRYFEKSVDERRDTPLRRVLLGMKSMEVLRRLVKHLAPAELQNLYAHLREGIAEAREVVPGSRWANPGEGIFYNGKFFLQTFLDSARRLLDIAYVRKVGESPQPDPDAKPTWEPHSNDRLAVVQDREGKVQRVYGPTMLQRDVSKFLRRLNLHPSALPHLMMGAAEVHTPEDLPKISQARLTPDELLEWTQTKEGGQYLEEKRLSLRLNDTWDRRTIDGGPSLVVGVLAMFGFAKLADAWGIDPTYQPQENFLFVASGAHVTGIGVKSVQEVVLNRLANLPVSSTGTRAVAAGGEAAMQPFFEPRRELVRDLGGALFKNFGFTPAPEAGFEAGLRHYGAHAAIQAPQALLYRIPMGMGAGLAAAATVDKLVSEKLLDLKVDSNARRAIHFTAFLGPDILRMIVGTRRMPLFFESPLARGIARGFSYGFLADLAFMLKQRVSEGSEEMVRNQLLYAHANELHDEAQDGFFAGPRWLVDTGFEMAAPSVANWWDSVELQGMGFRPNQYQIQARSELLEFSSEVNEQSRKFLTQSLVAGEGDEIFTEQFYRSVNYNFLFQEHLADANSPLAIMRGHWQLLHQRPMPENEDLRMAFNEQGLLVSGNEDFLLRYLFGKTATESDVLALRREVLFRRLDELQFKKDPISVEAYEKLGKVLDKLNLPVPQRMAG